MEKFKSGKNGKPVIISIVSTKSNTGKTTLIEGLTKSFKGRNYRVGVLKHDAHKFDIDKKGKDSYRFGLAGAENVVISSPEKLAMIQILKEEKSIEELMILFKDMDIVLVEGFKNSRYPKIEVHRKGIDNCLLCKNSDFNIETFIAITSDEEVEVKIPVLDLNNISQIANFIESKFLEGR